MDKDNKQPIEGQEESKGLNDLDYTDATGPAYNGVGVDAVGMNGETISGADRSLGHAITGYDENSGPGGYSGIADDPGLGGSTGIADDIGMHVEPGFSVGYDDTRGNYGIGPDTGNEEQGAGYRTLADEAEDIDLGADEQ